MTLPLRSWFLMQPPSDLHGIGHTARVMVWAAALTRGTPLFESVVGRRLVTICDVRMMGQTRPSSWRLGPRYYRRSCSSLSRTWSLSPRHATGTSALILTAALGGSLLRAVLFTSGTVIFYATSTK